jgi:hypothetical protein
MEALSFGTDDDEYRRAFLLEGVSWRNQYTRVVHGELTSDQILPDAAWIEWRSGVRPAVRQACREPVGVAAPPPREFPRDIVPSTQPVLEHARTVAVMASSDELARRIRTMLDGGDGVTEGTLFGAVAWMVNGNVACGILGDELLVRVDVSNRDRLLLLAEGHVHPVTTGTRTMPGFVAVDADAIAGRANSPAGSTPPPATPRGSRRSSPLHPLRHPRALLAARFAAGAQRSPAGRMICRSDTHSDNLDPAKGQP